jgi:hypothetical protein
MSDTVNPPKGDIFIHPPLLPIPRPVVQPLPPAITSISVAMATAGQTVTVNGLRFGDSQGNSYLAFSDAGVNWGAPGDAAAFQILSWSSTQIQFMVPVPSGPDNVWAVQPGSMATVFVATPNFEPNTMLQSNPVSLLIVAAPEISSISPGQAGPGATITLNGQNFGPQQNNGYVQFSDNGVNWGAPGDAATFNITSWSDTQITFLLPTPSGPWSATPGTTATVAVTNDAGLNSNQVQVAVTSGVPFPVTANSGDTQIGNTGNGNMQTAVIIQSDGSLTAMTHIWDTSGWGFMTGFHGATVITIFDDRGNQLDQWSNGPFGVEGGQGYDVTWNEQLTAADLASLYSISVVNFYDPQYSAIGAIADWILQNASAISSAAGAIAGAF